ncbi:MAG: efflux RND transporter periplasmic adaptor subunit [Verrucomicrobiota bacterium]
MNKSIWIIGVLFQVSISFGEGGAKCDCPTCNAPPSEKQFTLPALQGLEQEAHGEHADCDHDHAEHGHEGHAHSDERQAEEPVPHAGCDHDHGAEEEGGLELSAEMVEKTGVQIRAASGGVIAKSAVFPAEINLNRDRAAAVSPRYASIVRQVFAEIGDKVRKGDVLASLENRETLAVYTVSAPLDGVIISKDASLGETAGEDHVLFKVADLSSVWADISIFPQYQHLMRKGMAVEFVAHDGHTASGTVKYISPIVSHETRTFTARCVLEGARDDFTPGAFVRARINIESVEAAVVVPREAVQTLEGESVVFIPGEHGFQTAVVEVGLADDHSIEIKNGLKPGDRYVAAGAFSLKAEMVTSGMDPHAGHGH